VWVSTAFTARLLVAPRATRWTMAVFNTAFAADVLQIVYAKGEEQL
jgi:Protein of unknown function (DUF1360)